MTTTEIRTILHRFIDRAQDSKVKAIYTVVEAEIERGNQWQDGDFIAEMEKRSNELETEKVYGYTWNEVKARAKKTVKASTSR